MHTLDDIALEINACLTRAASSPEPLIEAGHLLIAAKLQVKHGEWKEWCKANVEWSFRRVQEAMKAAKNPLTLDAKRSADQERVTKTRDVARLLKADFPWSPAKDNEREIATVIKAIKRCSLEQRAYLWVSVYPAFKPSIVETEDGKLTYLVLARRADSTREDDAA